MQEFFSFNFPLRDFFFILLYTSSYDEIEAMHERSLVSVIVEPRSTPRLSSALFILPLLYLRDQNLRALTCVAKNASVEINL